MKVAVIGSRSLEIRDFSVYLPADTTSMQSMSLRFGTDVLAEQNSSLTIV